MADCMICCECNELLECCNQVCTTCVRQWATIQIKKPGFFKGNAKPTCLACKKDLDNEALEKILEPSDFDMYISGVPFASFKDLNCPLCDECIPQPDKFSQFVNCEQCFHKFCYFCLGDATFHVDLDCVQCYRNIMDNHYGLTFLGKNKDFYVKPLVAKKCECDEHENLVDSVWEIEDVMEIVQAEYENVKWQSENTKTCPNCFSSIEKDGGCLHMTCYKCDHEFCWECGDNWDEHRGEPFRCELTGISIETGYVDLLFVSLVTGAISRILRRTWSLVA